MASNSGQSANNALQTMYNKTRISKLTLVLTVLSLLAVSALPRCPFQTTGKAPISSTARLASVHSEIVR